MPAETPSKPEGIIDLATRLHREHVESVHARRYLQALGEYMRPGAGALLGEMPDAVFYERIDDHPDWTRANAQFCEHWLQLWGEAAVHVLAVFKVEDVEQVDVTVLDVDAQEPALITRELFCRLLKASDRTAELAALLPVLAQRRLALGRARRVMLQAFFWLLHARVPHRPPADQVLRERIDPSKPGFVLAPVPARMENPRAGASPRPEPIEDEQRQGFLSHLEWARQHRVEPEGLRKKLERRRKKRDDGWIEVSDKSSREPRFLYSAGFVESAIGRHRASGESSGERPSSGI